MSEVKSTSQTYLPYIVAGYASLFALAFLDNSRSPVFQDIIQDLKLADGPAGLFYSATSFMSFVLGRLSPRFLSAGMSLLNLTRLGHFLMMVGFLAISRAQNFTWLVLAAALFGVGYGMINLAENVLIVEGAAPQLRRRLLSGLHSIYAFSSLTAPVVISFLFELQISWREAFTVIAFVPAVAIMTTFWARSEQVPAYAMPPEEGAYRFQWRNFGAAVGIAMYVISEILVSTRLPLYLRRVENYAPETAARYLGLFFLLLFLGRLVFAFLKLERISNRQIMIVSLIGAITFTLLGIFVHPVWFAWAGLPMSPFFGVSLNYVTESFGQGVSQSLGAALSLQSLFVVLMHYGIGVITEYWGIRTAVLVTPVFLVISLILLIVSSRKPHARTY